MKTIYDLAPAKIWEDLCVARFQRYLDTGEYTATHCKTWDMLAWLDAQKELNA